MINPKCPVELEIRSSGQPPDGIDFIRCVKDLNLFIKFTQSGGINIGSVFGFGRAQHQPVWFQFEIGLILSGRAKSFPGFDHFLGSQPRIIKHLQP